MNDEYFRELVDIVAEIAKDVDEISPQTRSLSGRVAVLQEAMEERRTVDLIKQRHVMREVVERG